MLFNSIPFIVFLPIVVLIYYLIPQKIRYIWLLIASYFFYFCQSTSFVALLLLSTITTYIAGRLIYRFSNSRVKNTIVILTFIINAGIWLFIKYADFVLELAGSDKRFNLFLPIGISFYTLQALSYIMDCYRKKMEPEKNIVRYALFVSFFPSLLSGPINRGRDLIPELKCSVEFDLDNLKYGLMKMLWGYFLKLVIAARLVILVDNAYANADGYSGATLFIAAISFLFMLYCDFEGYSNIAIGAAKLLGINMHENFRQPFYSLSMGELWRRWHISLSTWLREYVYFTLGGNRRGNIIKYIKYFIVFLISGIWHGANFTFIIWGLLNGLFLVAGNVLMPIRDKIADRIYLSKYSRFRRILQRIGVYLLYAFTMIYFDSENVYCANLVIKRIFTVFSSPIVIVREVLSLGLGRANLLFAIVLAVFVMIIDGYSNKYDCDFTGLMKKTPTLVRWVLYIFMVSAIVLSANLTGQEFIYATM